MKQNENEVILGGNWPTWKRWIAFACICLVQFFCYYNFMLGTFVKPVMLKEISSGGFGFTLQQSEVIFSMLAFGTIPGTIAFSLVANKLGKRFSFVLVALMIALATFIPLLAPENYNLWLVSRLLAGFAIGGEFGSAIPLALEMFPQKYAGKLSSIQASTFSFAIMFGGMIYGVLGDENWLALVYTAIIPIAVAGLLMLVLVPNDYENVKFANLKAKESGKKLSYRNMYKGKYLWIGILTILLSGVNSTGYSAFSNNATAYLREAGLSSAVVGNIFTLQGIGLLVGYNFWGIISDKLGRKFPLWGMLLTGISVFTFMKLSPDNILGYQISGLLFGFGAGYSGMWGAYYKELFPSEYSSMSVGISFNGGRIVSMFAVPLIAGFGSVTNMTPIFLSSAVVFVIGTGIWKMLPETIKLDKKYKKPVEVK